MACTLFKAPPNTAPLNPVPAGAHALAQAYLDHALSTHLPLGSWEIDTLGGELVTKFYCHHTVCNGSPGCCPAVTLFKYTGPVTPTPAGPEPIPPVEGVMPPESIDWPLVAVTSGLAVGVVYLFHLALKHAGRRR